MARPGRRIGLARWLSKQGVMSRSRAEAQIRAGRVQLNGARVLDPEAPVVGTDARVSIDGEPLCSPGQRYLMLNKPRGLVTTVRDERSRDTVYRCFEGADVGWIAPVGRLDKASEGLLLFSSDSEWAAKITDPATGPSKTYHVQVAGIPNLASLSRMEAGVEVEGSEHLAVVRARILRVGERNAWLEIELDEGRNRQIRRILSALGYEVLRLVRIGIGPLALGDLAKGAWRDLTEVEIAALRGE